MMIKAIALLHLVDVTVRIPFEVEFHKVFNKDDPDDAYIIDDVVEQMFPHLSAFGYFVEDNNDGN